MWHWSQQPPISAPFAHGHSQSLTPSHAPIHQLPTHPMAVHHLTPQGMPSHFTSGQSPFVSYQPFNPGDFPHSTGYSNQMVAPPTQLHMPGGAGWSERHVGSISSEHLLTAGYSTRGLSHDSVQGGPSVGQVMAALTPTLPQTSPLPSASTPLPGTSLQTSPLEPLVSPHVSAPQQPMPQLAHPAVGSSPFSVDFLLRERPANMEGGEISYTQQDMQNSSYTDRAEGISRFAPSEVSTVPTGFGEGGESSSGDLQQFANSSDTLPQFSDPSDDLPQLSQQEVAEETAGGFPDKLSPFPLPTDFPPPSTPPEDSDKLTIALPPEKPFSPPQLVLIDREESQSHDLDQSDHPSIAMQGGITGSHVTGTTDSSPRPHEDMAQQMVPAEETDLLSKESSEKDPPAPPSAEPGIATKDNVSTTAEDKTPPVGLPKATLLSRRPHMVRHKHDYESEDDDVFLPNSPHHFAEQEQQHSPEQSGRSQPHPPEQSGQSQPHPPEQSGSQQPSPNQSEWSQPHPQEQSGSQQPSPNSGGLSEPHPPEQSESQQPSPNPSGWSRPHLPDLSNEPHKESEEQEWGHPSSSTANEVPAAAAAPPLVYRRRRGPRVALDQEKIQLPLTKGWRRLVRTRLLPDQNPRVDICYVTPCGRRLRTFPEIQRYLDNKSMAGDAAVGVAGLELEHFSFSKKAEVGEMIEIGGKADDPGEGSEGMDIKRKSGRGRRKIVREPQPPEAGSGMDLAPSRTEGGGRGRGRRRGRPRDVAGRAGGLGRGARKQREEDKFSQEPLQGAAGGQTLDQVVRPAGLVPLATGAELAPSDPEGADSQGRRISLEPHEISQLGEEDSESHDEAVGFHGKSHDVYLTTYSTINHAEGEDTADGLSVSTAIESQPLGSPGASREADQLIALSVDPSPLDPVGMATPILTVGQPLSATPPQSSPAVPKLEGVKRRGRKRKDPTRIEPQAPPPIKRPRGRPKGSGKAKKELPISTTGQPEVKKKRGRRPKLHPPGSTKHFIITSSTQDSQDNNRGNLGTAVCAVAGSPEPLKDGTATPSTSHVTASVPGVSVIVPATGDMEGHQETGQPSHGRTRKEEKRRQLLLKARVDRAKKKAESKHIQRAIITQRRLAQRQRRERERMLMKQARDRQEKLSKHKETEERELRRQRQAQQREAENQRRAQERTRRLLAHLRQQEVERERMALQHQRDREKAEQLKRPTEDLLVADLAPLPRLHPMTWVVLPASAFAKLLMAVEFGRSFEEFLELGIVPSVRELLAGLYSLDPRPLELFCVQLLKAILYSPGSDARTVSGCAIGRIEVREETLSELLRLYLTEMSELEEIASQLQTLPLASLCPNEKAQLLGFLVEELLASVALTREVDTRMDQLAALRRDKWKISLKLKRFRSRLTEVYGVGAQKKPVVYSGRGRPPKRAVMGLNMPDVGGDSSDEGEDPANPVTNEEVEEDSESEYSEEETDEETPETKEELQKRIKILKKKLQCLRVLIHSLSRQMRKFPLGQDRYARQYWLLPGLGGIIIEGVETSLHGNHQWDPTPKAISGRCSNEKLCAGVVVKEEKPSLHGHNQSDLSAGEVSEVDVVGTDSAAKCGGGVLVGGCEPEGVAKGMAGGADGGRSGAMVLLSQSMEYQQSDDPTTDSSRHSFEGAAGLQEGESVPSKQPESHPNSITGMGTGQMASSATMVMETDHWQPQLEKRSDGVSVITVRNRRSELDRQFGMTGASSDDIRTRLPFADSETPLPPSQTLITTDNTRAPLDDSQPSSPIAPIEDQNSMESSPSMGSQTDTAPSVSSSTGVLADESRVLSEPSSPPGTQDIRLPSSQCTGETTQDREIDTCPQLECMETTPTFTHEEQDTVPPGLWAAGQGPSSGSHDSPSQSLVAHDQPSRPSPTPTSHDSGCPSPCPSPQPWFSIFPRQPCERATYATVDPSQLQLSGGQQFVVAAPPTAHYAYMTQGGGAILSQPMLQQVGVGYTLVGNTLVPQAQYVSVNPSQAVQYVGQQGMQYVTIGGQQQPQGMIAIGGQQQPQGVVAIRGQQQPQGVVAIGGQQQPQGIVAIGGQQQPQGVVAIGGQQQPQGVVAIGGQQQPQGMVAIGGQQQSQSVQVVIGNQQTQGVVAIGGQQPQGMVAIGGQQPQGMVAIGGQQPQGVVTVGAQQSQSVQYINLGGGQVAMIQQEVDAAPVETPAEEVSEVGGASTPMEDSKDTVEGTVPEADSVGEQQLEVDSIQHSPSSANPKPDSYSPAMPALSKDKATPECHTPSHAHKLSESEEIHRVPNPTSHLVVQGDASETTPSAPPTSQYLTAVLPTGPGGQSQYVSLPADPRVLAGQCSYAVLQQPDGTSQIVLVENSSLGYSQSGGVMSLECPPPCLMCNEAEGRAWLTDITLMYAEHLPFLTPRPPHKETPPPREKTLQQLLAEQDKGLTHGWWQVTDIHQVDKILRSLSHRGYREKGLFKALQKNKEHISKLLEPSELTRCHTTFAEVTKGGVVRELKEKVDGVKGDVESGLEQSEKAESVLEGAGDGVGGAGNSVGGAGDSVRGGTEESVEVKGKPPIAEPINEELGSDKPSNHNSADRHKMEAASEDGGTVSDRMFPELAYEAALRVLEYLEGMQERLFEAQLHSTGSRPHPPLGSELQENKPQGSPLPSIASALLHLELSVDRRYLKPPLIARSLVEEKPRSGLPHRSGRGHRGRGQAPPPPKVALDAPPTTELLQWRSAVNMATSASQLAVCTNQLERCVAWEKSTTKVFCKVCHSSENESLLLLCDGCDRGTHTYCCKPKLDSIPDGDWYCAECAIGKRKLGSCDICESPRGVLLRCTGCARTVHKRCLNPPLSKMPSLPWRCHKCKKHPPRGRSKGGASSPLKKRPQKPLDDMAICRQMLRALEQHDEAGPFLEPVRKRKFPEYFRVIKRPMDFHTIRSRLREGRYPDKEAFAEEVRLVFSNCAFYNEDDSEIGVAGHSMKAFFEKRWSELSQ